MMLMQMQNTAQHSTTRYRQSSRKVKRTLPIQKMGMTNPLGLAKRCLLGDGLMVPVDDAEEADEADEESSS